MTPERVTDDACGISRRWLLAPHVAESVVSVNREMGSLFSAQGIRWPGLTIISGYRSSQKQAQVNPAVTKSWHSRCPALAVDLRVGDAPASTTPVELWATIAHQFKKRGARWGGDFKHAGSGPNKREANHFDWPGVTVPSPAREVAAAPAGHTLNLNRVPFHPGAVSPPPPASPPAPAPLAPSVPSVRFRQRVIKDPSGGDDLIVEEPI